MKLLAGTSKGLIIFDKKQPGWTVRSVHFEGLTVSMVYIDDRTATWWVGLSHRHWGEKLHYSNDQGASWHEAGIPSYAGYQYKPGKAASLKKIWVMEQAGTDRPGCLWLGTEPGGLFYSNDAGNSFHLNESLWNHPSRTDANQWFGAGKDYPFIHSIIVDKRDSNHVYVGVSCAGIFETKDGGKSWVAKNKGLIATYLPNQNAEVGHDPHRIIACRNNPDVIWQQNHCGIFKTMDGGENWIDVSGKNGFPKYGFALAIDDDDCDVAWVIPAQSDEFRIPVDLKVVVCKTSDGGNQWISVSRGLPSSDAFDIVLRHSFAKKGSTMSFGTNNGNLYVSEDRGETWMTINNNLATINCVVLVE
ncbi:MAG TPA: hypothetical protein VG737_03975 [Cyclobacteriaceae bacterium]|nr:hypothetical protein [Cyclobacteriaceae bacterium]